MIKPSPKNLALALLLIPIAFLFLFTFGEVFSGDITGFSHLLQTVPLLLLLLLAHKKPRLAGISLIILSLVLGIGYILTNSFPLQRIILVETLLFLPPFISGLLLILSHKQSNSPAQKRQQIIHHKPRPKN